MRWLLVLALAACSSYRGTAHDVDPAKLAREPGWLLLRDVPYVAQRGETECGAAALGMVVGFWTGETPQTVVAAFQPVPATGIAAERLRDTARARGLAAFVVEGELQDLANELKAGRPVIVGLSKPQSRDRVLNHYEVVIGIHADRKLIVTLDPQGGWRQNSLEGFYREWKIAGFVTLVISAQTQAARMSSASRMVS